MLGDSNHFPARFLERRAEELCRAKPSAEWLRILEERNIPAGPVRFIEEMFDDPQVVANSLVDEFTHAQEGKVRMVGPYAHFSGTPLPHAPPSTIPRPAHRRDTRMAGLHVRRNRPPARGQGRFLTLERIA